MRAVVMCMVVLSHELLALMTAAVLSSIATPPWAGALLSLCAAMAAFSSTATPRWASDLAGLPIILCTVIPALVHRLMRLLCVGHLAAIYVPVCAKSESNIQTIVAQSHSDQTICPSLPDAAPKSSDESCTQSPLCFIVPGYEVIYDLESFGVTASSTDGNSFTAGCSAELDANGDYVARAASACTISRDGGDLKGDAGDDVPDSIEFDVRGQAVNGEGEGSAVASLFIIDEGVDTIERVVKNDGTSDELFAVEPMIPSSSSAAGTSAPGPTYSDNILSYESTEEVLRDPSEVEQPTQTARVTPTLQEEAVSFGILHRVTCASYSLQKREFFPNASGEAFDVDLAHTMEDLSLRAPVPSGWSLGHTEENPTEPCSTSPPVADILGELAKLEDVGVVQHKEVPDLDSNDTLPFLEKMLPRRNPSRPSPRAVPSSPYPTDYSSPSTSPSSQPLAKSRPTSSLTINSSTCESRMSQSRSFRVLTLSSSPIAVPAPCVFAPSRRAHPPMISTPICSGATHRFSQV